MTTHFKSKYFKFEQKNYTTIIIIKTLFKIRVCFYSKLEL